MKRKAFTLVEIMIALVIIGLLSALLFSVFVRVRAKSHQTACLSNLRQLGTAVALYQQDYDDLFPRGADPTDMETSFWNTFQNGAYSGETQALPPLQWVLSPYVKNQQIWHCPADSGFDYEDLANQPLNARPTSSEAFGTSYYYRTEITLKRKKDLAGWETWPPYAQHGPEAINVLFDGSGAWHNGNETDPRRYNVLWGDGHVKNVGRAAFLAAWRLKLEQPT